MDENDISGLLPNLGEFYLHTTVLCLPSWPLLPPVVLFRKEIGIQGTHASKILEGYEGWVLHLKNKVAKKLLPLQ